MDIYWMEQTESDVPSENQWLSSREATCLSRMRFLKRRTDWRLGRWTAKHALASRLNLVPDINALAMMEILAAPSGAPEVFFNEHPAKRSSRAAMPLSTTISPSTRRRSSSEPRWMSVL